MEEHELHCIKTEPAHSVDLSEPAYHCIKTETANPTDVSEHAFHCIKSEYCSGNDQTKAKGNTVGFDTNSSVFCLKDDYAVQDYSLYTPNVSQREAINTEPARVVMDCTGICLKHEHTYCEDDTYPSTLMACFEGECGETDIKLNKSIHCVESFSRLDSLSEHNKLLSGDKPFKCGQCMKSFSQKSDLVRHIRVHTSDKPHTCEQCMKTFTIKSHLVQHIKVHSGDKPFKCEQCMKAFSQKSTLINILSCTVVINRSSVSSV
jgi:uncharacterized Zn-finger protein